MSVIEATHRTAEYSASYGLRTRAVQIKALLDVLPHPTAAFDTSSRVLYANRSLRSLLQHDAESDAVLAVLNELGRSTALARCERSEQMNTRGSRYDMRAAFLDIQLIGYGETVVISVEPKPHALPAETELQQRFVLTAQEARVALLLAQRARTLEIADQLRITKNTVRRHVERVLSKLQVSTRTDIRDRLLSPHRST